MADLENGTRWLYGTGRSRPYSLNVAVHRRARVAGSALVVAFMLFWALGPIAWMLLTSIKPDSLVAVVPPVWIFAPTAANYLTLFASADFQRYLVNTLIVASCTSALAVASTAARSIPWGSVVMMVALAW